MVCPTQVTPPTALNPHGGWSEWSEPCDVQLYSGAELPEPAGFYRCHGVDAHGTTDVCRILPDGTPLYEYALDGIPWDERGAAPVQTYFAGLPLTHPAEIPKTWIGGGAWPAHNYRPDITGTPAPYAWHDYRKTGGGYGTDKLGYYPVQGVPRAPTSFWERSGLSSLANYACAAISTGLSIGGPALEITGGAGAGANKLATTFYKKVCSGSD